MGDFMRRRISVLVAALLALASGFTMVWLSDTEAGADEVTQTFACFSPLTNQYSTFPLPLSGEGSPSTVTPGGTTTFSSLDVTATVPTNLVVAAIGADLIDFVTDPALLGSIDPLTGGDGVNTVTNTTTARYTVSNDTVAGNTSATGGTTAPYFIVFDGENPSTLQIYVETSPGSWDGSGTDGLVQVSILPVVIALTPNIVAMSDGTENDMTLAIATGPLPANPAGAPTLLERNNAPLVLLNNLGLQANFYCWPGMSQGAINPVTGLPGPSAGFTPAPSVAIDTVVVETTTTTTTTLPPTTTTTTTLPPTTTTTTTLPPTTTTTTTLPPTTTTTTTLPPTTTTTTTLPPLPRIVPRTGSIVEGNSGTKVLQIPVVLSAPSGLTVTASWSTVSDSAVAPDDFVAASGTVSFAPGETSKSVAVTVKGDTLVEGDEQFVVAFSNPSNATLGGWFGLGFGFITDDDPQIVPKTGSIVEGNSGTKVLQIPVVLSAPSGLTVTASWSTVSDSAVAPDDFVAASGTVSFAPGETSKSVAVTVKGDTLVEGDEQFVVAFSNPSNATLGGWFGLGFGFITDDDPQIVPKTGSIVEGNSGTKVLQIPVVLSAPSGLTVTASWSTVSDSAVAPDDFVAASGTVSFAPGETSKSVAVTVKGDTLVEGDEQFVVAFSNPSNATLGGWFGLGFGIIIDDDV